MDSSSVHWFCVRIVSLYGAHVDCIAQLSDEEREILACNVGRTAACGQCRAPSRCPICTLGGGIILTDIHEIEWEAREIADGDGSINRAYVFVLVDSWRKTQRHYSKSR